MQTTFSARLITAQRCRSSGKTIVTFMRVDLTVRALCVRGLHIPVVTRRVVAIPFAI